jgi:hypothetical protein
MDDSVYCMGCKVKTVFNGDADLVEYKTARGVKYCLKGVCSKGHKVSKMIKKPVQE